MKRKSSKVEAKAVMYCICTGTKARILAYVGRTGLGGLHVKILK